ncbi:GCN5 family acetyltransferase [Burkholderia sp. PAMC 28687]|uniref:GNAT family N-acetyltransferase n=1 Tax=Burkholderiaceae TaxID=119060 RepID=UPI0007805DE3|nr:MULTISPECIES: GNAT family N-acetyltransferase [Burkholderiaceae]AMM13932.1 GCN5 family acetyltransferase [Burkholderia sp. PAMC 28687]
MNIEFKRLPAVRLSEIISLLSDPLVLRHMPLSDGVFDEERCRAWVEGKELQWQHHGYGPWAFFIDGKFAGWGGLQLEHDDADLALVLAPEFWGLGHAIYKEIIEKAFDEMKLESITALLPTSRNQTRNMLRLGFEKDGETELNGKSFIRYRLFARQGK